MPSDFLKLEENEKAFVIAAIQIRTELEKREREKINAGARGKRIYEHDE